MTNGLSFFGATGETFGETGDVFGFEATPTPEPTPAFPAEIDLVGGSRVDRFVYELLDSSLNVIGEINPVVTINGSVVAPRIRTSIQGQANRVMSSLVLIPEQATIDPRTQRIRPNWADVDGTLYPLGVYRIVDVSVVQFSGGDHIETTCASEDAVHHSPTTVGLSWPAGTQVADIITELAGVLNIAVTDADPTTAELGEPLSYPAGSADWWEVYATVATAAGMVTPYFTLAGIWRWRTAPDWDTVQPDHVFSTSLTAPTTEQRIVESTLVQAVTLFDSPNTFVATNNASKGTQIVGIYRLPASAPNSYERTGVIVAEYVNNAGLASQSAADSAARAAAAEAMDDVGSAQMDTPLDARIDFGDAVSADDFLYRIVGWSCQLMPGREQSHDLRRIYRAADADGQYFNGTIG
jgi:hypothetical protein